MASGRVTRLRGQPFDINQIDRSARWAYDNDLTLSVIDGEPPNAKVTQGAWWPKGYRGPPLAAMSEEAAKGGNLKLGDEITVSVLGREVDARIAVLRKVDFGGFGPGFNIILDTYALDGATLRNIAIAKASKAQEDAITRQLGSSFPEVNVISVREQLEAASRPRPTPATPAIRPTAPYSTP